MFGSDGLNAACDSVSNNPVSYFTGEIYHSCRDLETAGLGGFAITRGFAQNPAGYYQEPFGIAPWRLSQIPWLVQDQFSGTYQVVFGARLFRSFYSGFSPQHFYKDTLSADVPNAEITYTDTQGNRWVFNDFHEEGFFVKGRFKRSVSASGIVTSVTWDPTPGPTWSRPLEIIRTFTFNGTVTNESYLFEYPVGVDRILRITQRRNINGGAWTTIRKSEYTYYGAGSSNGPETSLQRMFLKNAADVVLETKYYRYYALDGGVPAWAGLKYVVDPKAYERLKAACGGTDAGVDAAADTVVATYANLYFEKDSSRRVTKEVVQGAGCDCGTNGSKGTYTLNYSNSSFGSGYNIWSKKAVEEFRDKDGIVLWTKTVYMNYAGLPMLHVLKDQSTLLQWRTFYQYDGNGRLILKAAPSAVTGHDETKQDLLDNIAGNYLHLSDSAGLIQLWDYATGTTATTSTAGDVQGFLKAVKTRPGELGTVDLQEEYRYIVRSGSSGTTYPLKERILYKDPGSLTGFTTVFIHAWEGATNHLASLTIQHPPVTFNGSGVSVLEVTNFDLLGRRVWFKDGDGFIHYTEYDQGSGAIKKSITDVNTSLSPDFIGLPLGWTTPSGGGLHLITLTTVDGLGRPTRIEDPKHHVTYVVHNDSNWEVRVYPGWTGTFPTGPTQVTRQDKAGSYLEYLTTNATPTLNAGAPTGQEAILTANLQTLSREYLDTGDRPVIQDVYYFFTGMTYSPSPNIGLQNTNYHRTSIGYESHGQTSRMQNPVGTIERTVYDGLGRPVSNWIGTNDSPPTGFWSPTNNSPPSNMVKVQELRYDDPNNTGVSGVGDGNVTQQIALASDVTLYTTQRRYDYRNRVSYIRTPDGVIVTKFYNLRDQLLVQRVYGDTNGNLIPEDTEQREVRGWYYDERLQNWQTFLTTVTSTGFEVHAYFVQYWFNGRGLPLKQQNPNYLFTKHVYDGARRPIRTYECFDDSENAPNSYVHADDVSGDIVLEQVRRVYDPAGNEVMSAVSRRHDNDTLGTGELAITNGYLDVVVQWYDRAHRLTHVGYYGRDNGAIRYVFSSGGSLIDTNGNGIPNEAEDVDGDGILYETTDVRQPNTSDDYIVRKYEYDISGFQHRITDNLGRITHKTFDRQGKGLSVIENYANGAVGTSEWASDRTTGATFTNGYRLDTVTARNAKGSTVELQNTKHLYESPICASWVTSTIYPDSTDTTSVGTDQVKFTYDRLGRKNTVADQRGVVHTYSYDSGGRLSSAAVTTLPPGVDGSVLRVQIGYDEISRWSTVTSYDAVSAGNVVNQVKFTYNLFYQLIKSEQSHSGAVGGATPAVQYNFVDGYDGVQAKYARLVSTVYPGGRTVYSNYGTTGSIGDRANRLDNLADDASGTVKHVQYTYFGSQSILKVDYPGVTGGLSLNYGTGASYSGYDRFGRVIDQKWQNNAATTFHDRYAHTYDRAGNCLSRDIQATQAPATAKDEYYVYDGLNRLTDSRRGSLTGAPPAITQAASNYYQQWSQLEPIGNWKQYKIDTNGGAGGQLSTQARLHNLANEIDDDNNDGNAPGASITGTGVNWIDPSYDKAGSMKMAPKPGAETTGASRLHFVHDAWGRLVQVLNDSGGNPGTTLVTYVYDGLGRRIKKILAGGDTLAYYYNERGQVLEIRRTPFGGAERISELYLWDLRHIDAVAVRFRNADNSADGSVEETLYYTQDDKFNTTALVNASGTVLERYAYEPYGKVLIFDAAWATRASSSYANEILYSGYRQDPETQLFYVRNRYYHPTLGRWIQRDPIGYADGMNLYEYVGSSPIDQLDPTGLFKRGRCFMVNMAYSWDPAKKTIPLGAGQVDFKLSLTIQGMYRDCNLCCDDDTKGNERIGQLALRLSGEVGIMYGKENVNYGGAIEWDLFIGVRAFTGFRLQGQASLHANTCLGKVNLDGKGYGAFFVGIEGGVKGVARVNKWIKTGWIGVKAMVRGRAMVTTGWTISCNESTCTTMYTPEVELRVTVIVQVIKWQFEIGFTWTFPVPAITNVEPSPQWIKDLAKPN